MSAQVFGFESLGNSCHLSAVLSAMLACPPFLEKIEPLVAAVDSPVAQALNDLCLHHHAGNAARANAAFKRVYAALTDSAPGRRPNLQEDSHADFFQLLELASPATPYPSGLASLFSLTYRQSIHLPRTVEPLTGEQIVYELGKIVPLPDDPDEVPEAIKIEKEKIRGFHPEPRELENIRRKFAVAAPDGVIDVAVKVARLHFAPPIIAVMFKRYNESLEKIPGSTGFPLYFTLPAVKGRLRKYRAVSTVCHVGTLDGGHYTCERATANGKFVRISDDRVEDISRLNDEDGQVYMVFYVEDGVE